MTNEADRTMAQAKMAALCESAMREMPGEIKRAEVLAQVRRVHYDASIRKGFTPEQALILCAKAYHQQ